MKAPGLMKEMVDSLWNLLPQLSVLIDAGDQEAAEALFHRECAQRADAVIGGCISDSLNAPAVRRKLAQVAEREGLRFHHVQSVSIRLSGGTQVSVDSPWFKRKGKPGKRKRGPKASDSSRKGCHLGLERLGIVDKNSPVLVDRGVRLAAAMPSFSTAASFLKAEGTPVSERTMRNATADYADLGYAARARHAVGAETAPFAGARVQLSVDGGRARERRAKAGRIPKGLKRRGFDAPWREAMLFTLHLVDEKGVPVKEVAPLVDGVVDGEARHADFLRLLREYVITSGAVDCKELILVCDGAPWHWKDIPDVLVACGIDSKRITQVLDYTHAKQNVHELADLCTCHAMATKDALVAEAKEHLYAGNIDQLAKLLLQRAARGNKRRISAKLDSYFKGNATRLTYADFVARGVPIGSGAVESAIRRILNLRIKAPGSFWIPANAEAMIYVRANLLYGRWAKVQEARRDARRQRFGDCSKATETETAA